LDGNCKILVTQKGKLKIKTHSHTPFDNQKISVTIRWWGCVKWQLKKFGHHPRNQHCPMAIEYFQLPLKVSLKTQVMAKRKVGSQIDNLIINH
jgi:hypothetical protein